MPSIRAIQSGEEVLLPNTALISVIGYVAEGNGFKTKG